MGAAAGSTSLQGSARQLWLTADYLSGSWPDGSAAGYSRCSSADLDAPVYGSGTAQSSSASAHLAIGSTSAAESEEQQEHRLSRSRSSEYARYTVWALASLFAFAGATLLAYPWFGTCEAITGCGLLACGVFFACNPNNMLSFWLMLIEVSRLRRRVAFFRSRARQQFKTLSDLKKSDMAFQEFDSRFDGSAIVAKHDLPKLKQEVRDQIIQNARDVCRLFVDPDPHRLVRVGRELGEAMRIFNVVFRNEFPDFNKRCALLQRGLEASRRFRADGGLSCEMLATLVGETLATQDTVLIPSRILESMGQLQEERSEASLSAAVDDVEAAE